MRECLPKVLLIVFISVNLSDSFSANVGSLKESGANQGEATEENKEYELLVRFKNDSEVNIEDVELVMQNGEDYLNESSAEDVHSKVISELYEGLSGAADYNEEICEKEQVTEEEGCVYESAACVRGESRNLQPDNKDEGDRVTDQTENNKLRETVPSENKAEAPIKLLDNQSPPPVQSENVKVSPYSFTTDSLVIHETFTDSQPSSKTYKSTETPLRSYLAPILTKLDEGDVFLPTKDFVKETIKNKSTTHKHKMEPIQASNPERLTMQNKNTEYLQNEGKIDQNFKLGFDLLFDKSKFQSDKNLDYASKIHQSLDNIKKFENIIPVEVATVDSLGNSVIEKSITNKDQEYFEVIQETKGTTETTVSSLPASTKGIAERLNYFESGTIASSSTLKSIFNENGSVEKNRTSIVRTIYDGEDASKDDDSGINNTNSSFEKYLNSNISSNHESPTAEKLRTTKDNEKYLIETSIGMENREENPHIKLKTGVLHLRDHEDRSEEDDVVIKSLLSDYSSFKKEKIEPGVLFEECSDCDLRILPIRPSEQRSPPELDKDSETPPTFRIKFADLPERTELQITKLGLSDGIFLFSYLSDFLSWIQPNEFPVDLLRDALRNQITWVSLIAQSLQVEAGFVACLVVGVLLALAVPVAVLSHACYRVRGGAATDEHSGGWAGNCKRRTLVFILQVLLALLLAGMVAMFVTNEQLSSAVVQSPDVLQTSLTDVSEFVHNAHLQLHFLVTQSLDQTLQAIYADLDNVDSLLGRPIQRELVKETGLDVALESLSDLTRETKTITQQVERLLDDMRMTQEMLVSSREKLLDLRQQVELFRRACGPRDRALCDTIDASGLDITLRIDKLKTDDRLGRMRRMGGAGLEVALAEARDHFMNVPSRVEADTRDARETIRRLLIRQRAEIADKSDALERFAREVTGKVNEAKYEASFWLQDVRQYEYWRWIICLGGGVAVFLVWTMLLCSLCCGCCGSERAAGPTILMTVVLVCLFSTALWMAVLVGLILGGHGEVFLCRPLYDQPAYPVISDLVDRPGVFYDDHRTGGFIANVLYGNDTLDVPIKQVLEECHNDRPIYTTLGLQRIFDLEHAVDERYWGGVSTQLRAVKANLSGLEVLSPALQQQLSDLLASLSVNFTEHRIQMSKPLTGKDMDSFARQLDNIGNQMRDLATASRMETLSSRTRRLIDSHIKPLEGKKDGLVYQLTALEVQTGPLQRQVNQSLSHLKTIQFFINSQGESIAHAKSREYGVRLLDYLRQLRAHVVDTARGSAALCRPLWEVFNSTRLFLCRHTMDPLNGYWFATMWCLLVLLVATPVCLKLVDYYRAQGSGVSGGPESLIQGQDSNWSSPGYATKSQNGHVQ